MTEYPNSETLAAIGGGHNGRSGRVLYVDHGWVTVDDQDAS